MRPPAAHLCPLCQLRSRVFSPNAPLSWQQTRSMAQLEKNRPSRMILSPSVAKPHTPRRRDVEGPFAATNRTSAGFRFEADRRRMLDRQAKLSKSRLAPANKLAHRKFKTERHPGDMKALKMQRSLAHIGYGHRASVKSKIDDVESFREFPLLPVLQDSIPSEALKGMLDISPTPIQRLAIPTLLAPDPAAGHVASSAMKQYLLAAETGSGKTLAYLLPTVDAIKRADLAATETKAGQQEEIKEGNKHNLFELEPPPLSNAAHSSAARPKAIVLLPTSELVEQVGGIFKSFSHTAKLRVALISAAHSAAVIRNRLFGPGGVDIVVSTPHLLKNIAESDPNILSRVTHLIVDEADSLLDRSFAPLTLAILDRATPSLRQLILCSATIPRGLDSFLQKRFPNLQRLATPNLHAIPRRVQLSVVDVDRDPYRGNRDLACADSIWQIGRTAAEHIGESQSPADTKRVIVFVNERDKASELADYLATKGIDAVAMNRDTTEQRKGEVLSAFTTAPSAPPHDDEDMPRATSAKTKSTAQSPGSTRILSNVKALVMTDIGSRGIDTVAVRNVVLYDVPHTTIDFIHRLGRIGRMGRRGRGFVLVSKHDRKDVVREIREGMFRGQALI